RDDDHEAVLLPELHRLALRLGEEIEAEALDGRAAILGLIPAHPLDPHPRPVRDELRVDGDDAAAGIGLPERRRDAVVEASVRRAPRDVHRDGEAAAPRLGADGRRLFRRGEDVLVAPREGGERDVRALRGLPALTTLARHAVEARRLPVEAARLDRTED